MVVQLLFNLNSCKIISAIPGSMLANRGVFAWKGGYTDTYIHTCNNFIGRDRHRESTYINYFAGV